MRIEKRGTTKGKERGSEKETTKKHKQINLLKFCLILFLGVCVCVSVVQRPQNKNQMFKILDE